MKPALEIMINKEMMRVNGVTITDYEVARLSAISTGGLYGVSNLKNGLVIEISKTGKIPEIIDLIYMHDSVPSLGGLGDGEVLGSLTWEPIEDVWVWTGNANEETMQHVRRWWDDEDMFDRYVTMLDNGTFEFRIKAILEEDDDEA